MRDVDAGLDVAIERHHLREQAVDGGRGELGPGHAGVARELVDQRLHLADLAHDDRDALLEQLADVGVAVAVLDAQALGGEPDRGERVLDLVRDALRGLGPGRELLRLDQLGEVLEHDAPCRPSPPGAVAQVGDLDLEGAPFAAERRGSPRRLRAGRPAPAAAISPARRDALGVAPGVGERAPDELVLRLGAACRARRRWPRAPCRRAERDHAGGEVLEDGADQRALLGEAAVGRHAARGGCGSISSRLRAQLLRHAVERVDHGRHLVVGGDLDLLVEVAAGDPPGALGERLDRQHQAAGEEEPHPGGGEQDEQRHQDEDQAGSWRANSPFCTSSWR